MFRNAVTSTASLVVFDTQIFVAVNCVAKSNRISPASGGSVIATANRIAT